MKNFGLFLLVALIIVLLGGGVFLAFWDMPAQTTTETIDITKGVGRE